MAKRKPLEWYNTEGDTMLGIPACVECAEKCFDPMFAEACASVGIEYGKSTGLMMREFIDGYHAGGHK